MLGLRSWGRIVPLHPKSPASCVNPNAVIAAWLRHGRYGFSVPVGVTAVPGQAVATGLPEAVWKFFAAQPSFSNSDVEKFPLSISAVGTVARSKPVSNFW